MIEDAPNIVPQCLSLPDNLDGSIIVGRDVERSYPVVAGSDGNHGQGDEPGIYVRLRKDGIHRLVEKSITPGNDEVAVTLLQVIVGQFDGVPRIFGEVMPIC